jgi:hypothetical protein
MPKKNTRPARRAFRKETHGTDAASTVFGELQQRQLTDLDTCRRVWEDEVDPLALCEAVRLASLPEWLVDSLLVMMTEGVNGYPPLRRKLWRDRARAMNDAVRALNVAGVRVHPQLPRVSWKQSYAIGEELAARQYNDMPRVSPARAKSSYESVRRNLVAHPMKYYLARDGMKQRIDLAWGNTLDAWQAQLSNRAQGAVEDERSTRSPAATQRRKKGRPRHVTFTVEQFLCLGTLTPKRPITVSQFSDLSGLRRQKVLDLIEGEYLKGFRPDGINQFFIEYESAAAFLRDLRIIE